MVPSVALQRSRIDMHIAIMNSSGPPLVASTGIAYMPGHRQ